MSVPFLAGLADSHEGVALAGCLLAGAVTVPALLAAPYMALAAWGVAAWATGLSTWTSRGAVRALQVGGRQGALRAVVDRGAGGARDLTCWQVRGCTRLHE